MHRRNRKTWLPVAQMFILLCIFVWLNEILDLPHLLLGAPPTPINWREALSETVLIATVGVLAISRLVRDVTSRARAEKEIQRRTAQLEALRQVGLELTAQLNLDTLLHFIVSRAIELVAGGTAGGLDFYRPERDLLERAVTVGYGVTPLGTILHRGEDLSGKVWETGEPLIVDDYQHWEGRAAAWEDHPIPITASVGVPVRWGEKFLGVLHVASDSARTFSPADAELLSLFATQAAVAIRNARLYEAERKRATQLAVVNQVARKAISLLEPDCLLREIVTAIQQSFEYHNVILLQLDKTAGELGTPFVAGAYEDITAPDYRQAVGVGMIGWTAETGQTLLSNDVSQEPRYIPGFPKEVPTRSELCVPLKLAGQVIGVLDIQDTRLVAFDETDLVALETLADQIAVAIENARLYEEAQQELAERKRAEEALKASKEYISNIIDSSLDMIIACDMQRHIVEFNTAAQETFGYRREEVIGEHVDILYADPQESLAVHKTTINEGRCVREILDRRKNGEVFPAFLSASLLHDASGEVVGVMGVARDITARKRAEKTLRRRNRELALLNRASQALTSTLDLGQVLATILEAIRHLLDVTASSVWLIDQETDELVCRQATGPQGESVLGWRLEPGQGLAGWVACAGESLIVPDVWADERHFKGVDQQTGLPLRSILTVPLRVKNGIIGVLQVVDTQADRFQPTDLRLAESLATTAAIAIENARLYEQARQDAETKSVLLDEINHRVKNNLAAIIGLLYTELRYADIDNQATYQSVIQNLVNRVQGLTTVHSLLSASGWAPLRIGELVGQTIRSSLQTLPRDKHVSVDMIPSPVHVTPDQAQNLALVINELATNTVKHALQGRDTAHITVRVTTEIESDGVQVEFRDDGPGYPEEVLRLERYNVGLDLVQNVVRKNLRGELSLYNDHGAVAVIQFKAEIPRLATLATNDILSLHNEWRNAPCVDRNDEPREEDSE